jgi:hypothetical protein
MLVHSTLLISIPTQTDKDILNALKFYKSPPKSLLHFLQEPFATQCFWPGFQEDTSVSGGGWWVGGLAPWQLGRFTIDLERTAACVLNREPEEGQSSKLNTNENKMKPPQKDVQPGLEDYAGGCGQLWGLHTLMVMSRADWRGSIGWSFWDPGISH